MKSYTSSPILFFTHYMQHYKAWVIALLGGIFFHVLLQRLNPYYFSLLIDKLGTYVSFKTDIWSGVFCILILILATDILANLWRRLLFSVVIKIEPDMTMRIRQDVTQYVLHHAAQYLTSKQSGKISAQANQLADRTTQLFWIIFWGFYRPIISILIVLGMLALVNWVFVAVFVFWMGILLTILVISSGRVQKFSADNAEKTARVTGTIVDIISNSLLVKTFANFKFEQKLLHPLLEDEKGAGKIVIRKIENSKCVQVVIVGLFNFTIILAALYLWQLGRISTGNIVLVLMLTNGIAQTFNDLVHELLGWYKTTGIIRNALEIINTPHGVKDVSNAKALTVQKGRIDFTHVDFAYQDGRPVFKDFSLHIKAGERVGLVGVSGSGKSSFINLLQRLYDIQGGQILIDGQDIAKVTQDSVHKNIALIPQETALFHRTIMENIAYGNPEADTKKVIVASKKAYAHGFICQTPNGYDSLVGDRGVKLSGGQRQRVAIARAFLKKAPILILDEATSALDSESEKYIQDSMKTLMRGKTVIAVAHRLSTLKEMDRIVVMSRGRIIEQGSPADLLKKKGKYAKLWRMQTERKD